ncbi:hypothetical protein Osc7112_2472 [Oscillatoria nigro-viridis PCC 7112]|uniref:DCD domain-containing protein n=1 Tax=Phormidium nigroviride PCC 7112 TaxID=179408 RepID=K9VI37_9CYAN|nr:hypothetical protein [Oscillatoria nigro-viridis]AFZ06905.1 hypothetical protein Osc7112_2472 [Oscillatoria nigro-viridis PCC 7112]
MGLPLYDLQYEVKEVQFFQNSRSRAAEFQVGAGFKSWKKNRTPLNQAFKFDESNHPIYETLFRR